LSFALLWLLFLMCSSGTRSSLPEGRDGPEMYSIDLSERSSAPMPSEKPCGGSGFRKRARRCRSPNRPQDRGLEARDRQITGECGVELILDAIGRDSLKKDYQRCAVFRPRRDLVRGSDHPAELGSPTAIGN